MARQRHPGRSSAATVTRTRSPSRKHIRSRPLRFEPLEDRRVLSILSPMGGESGMAPLGLHAEDSSAHWLFSGERLTVGQEPYSVVVADLNGDGVPDLVTANGGDGTVSVLLGRGNGTFQPQTTFEVGREVWSVAVGDLNGNGIPDLVTANAWDDTVSVLIGRGDGTFEPQVTFEVGSGPYSVAIADLNDDGVPDLVAANWEDDTVSVLIGRGDATFEPQVTFAAGPGPYHVAIADFDGDGIPDVAATNWSDEGTVSILLGLGDGTFDEYTSFAVGSSPEWLAVADLNGDGVPDLVTANYDDDTVSVLLGRGDGTFEPQAIFDVGSGPYSVAVADLDGDGVPDLIATNGWDHTISVLLGRGDGTFDAQTISEAGRRPYHVAVADFDGDGLLDLVTTNMPSTWLWPYNDGTVSVLLGRGDGTFGQTTLEVGEWPSAVAVADLTGDGVLDLVAANARDDTLSVLLGRGDGTFEEQSVIEVGSRPSSVAVADLNGDGVPDLVVANDRDDTVSVLLGVGDGTFEPHVPFDVAFKPNSVVIVDLNGNGVPDLVTSHYSSWQDSVGTVSVLLGVGDGTFESHVTFEVGLDPYRVAVSDLNGDGIPDLVTANASDDTVSVLLGVGDGTFEPHVPFDVGAKPTAVAVADLNGNGVPDLVTTNESDMTVSVLLGRGDGTFEPQVSFEAGYLPWFVAVGDLDRDGVPDIVTANSTSLGTVSVLLGRGDGTFEPQRWFPVGSEPAFIAIADLNRDGAPDLVTANWGNKTLSVLLGHAKMWHVPTGRIVPPVEALEVRFPQPMDIGSFSLANDIESFTGPAGTITPSGFSWLSDQVLQITFPVQTAAGHYEMVLGPAILDAEANPMDGPYVAAFSISSPQVTGHSPRGMVPPPVDSLQFSFSRAMDTTSFSLAEEIVSFTGPEGDVTPTGFAWFDDRTLEVYFEAVAAGQYSFVLAPTVYDTFGNALDVDAGYEAEFSISGPQVARHVPNEMVSPPVDSLQLSFSRRMDTTSFSLAEDIVSFTGPEGDVTPTGFAWVEDTTLEVYFEAVAAGQYSFVLAPTVYDTFGNGLDVDEAYEAEFSISAPKVSGHLPSGTVPPPVDSLQFSFSRMMDTASFSLAEDIVSFTGPEGDVTPTGFAWVDDTTLEVYFEAVAAGQYSFVLAPTVYDTFGNALDVDEGYVGEFSISGPHVTAHSPIGTVPPLDSLRLFFSHAMDTTSFSLAEGVVSFTGPEGDVTPTGFAWEDDTTLQITFAPQWYFGSYQFLLAPSVYDIYGNLLDQDRDGVGGEPVEDRYTATLVVGYTGTLLQDTTWGPDRGAIVVDGTLTIASGVTLTIEAGTVVKFTSGGAIIAAGRLDVRGTAAQPVVFTSIRDDTAGGDTNGDGDDTTPAPGDWTGFIVRGTGYARLENFEIRYATTAINADYSYAQADLLGGILRDSSKFGIYTYKPYVEITGENLAIVNNGYSGIYVQSDARLAFQNCTIVGNGFTGSGHYWHDWASSGIFLALADLTIENSIVAFNRNGLYHYGGAGPPNLTVRNSLFWNPSGDELVTHGEVPRHGVDETLFQAHGNIVANPLFVNREAGNHELAAGSPAIDAGRGLGAPATDILGRPRFDDLGMPNVGTGHPAYVDIGAYERQEHTAAGDLAVRHVATPLPMFVSAGEEFTVEWRVANVGAADCAGPWTDTVYLSRRQHFGADAVPLGTFTYQGDLAPGERYTGTLTGGAPDEPGVYYVIVRANADGTLAEPVVWNNVMTGTHVLAVDLPVLEVGQSVSGTVTHGQWDYVRLEAEPGNTVVLGFQAAVQSGATGLYVRYGAPPTLENYDARAAVPHRTDQELRILSPREGTYFVGIYGTRLPDGSTDYVLSAEPTDLAIHRVSPGTVGNAGPVTLEIIGESFRRGAQVTLVGPDGVTVIEGDPWFQDASTLYATLDLAAAGAAPGFYDLSVTQPGVASVTKSNAVRVMSGGAAVLSTSLTVPGRARPGRNIPVTVSYVNAGRVDMPSPLMTLQSNWDTTWFLPSPDGEQSRIEGDSVTFLALSPTGPAAVLRPGQRASFTITVRAPFVSGSMEFALHAFGAPGGSGLHDAIDWAQLGADLRPADLPGDAWNPLLARLEAQIGTTWGDYLDVLRDNANHLAEIGQRVYNTSELFAFEFVQAATMGAPPLMEAARDAFAPAPGLPLTFERYFLPQPVRRARLGPLGRGWMHFYQITLYERSDGSVAIHGPSIGFDRSFQPDGRGGYRAAPGDHATLVALSDGEFRLTEQNGLEYRFHADGQWHWIEDTNGNRLTASYDSQGRLIAITHSSGDQFAFEYDSAGRLVTLIGQAGRATYYAYDATGEHLLSVTAGGGQSTSYTYVTGAGPLLDHHLASITYPGDLQVQFVYDGLGRLAGHHLSGGEPAVGYTYSTAGRTVMTDVLGNTTTTWLDSRGRIAMIEDALGNRSRMTYDATGNLAAVVDPTGAAAWFTFDTADNLIAARDPMGRQTEFAYGDPYDNLQWIYDARGNAVQYVHDDAGNLTRINYEDGSYEDLQYDDDGNLSAWTNRRGETVTYTYNARGQVVGRNTSGTLGADDFIYTFDTVGRITSTTGPEGTTVFMYDADHQRLVQIDYPAIGDKPISLAFEYDVAGRRTKSTDQDGHVLNYFYDTAGRLVRMTDAAGEPVVDYEYDAAGRLVGKTLGNGVHTTYDYNAVGQIINLVNRRPDETVLSRFEYTYDDAGRRVAMETHYGLWTYQYDVAGQLARAVLVSTDTDVPDQDLTYVYDDVGNRIRTIINGETTEYTTNNMNQYVQIGDRTYVFDADGNLIQETGPDGTTTYSYNRENRLVAVHRGDDAWYYTYDALGNRIGVEENGAVTRYVVDPLGLGNVVGQYDATGDIVARYAHGTGLLGRFAADGDPAYYTLDAIGNTSELTGPAADAINSYVYNPFGEVAWSHATAANPFEYLGAYGIMAEDNGLHFIRARYYDSSTGRFHSPDPIGLHADINAYRYGLNNPLSFVDVNGLWAIELSGWFAKKLGVSGSITIGLCGISVAGGVGAGVGTGGSIVITPGNFEPGWNFDSRAKGEIGYGIVGASGEYGSGGWSLGGGLTKGPATAGVSYGSEGWSGSAGMDFELGGDLGFFGGGEGVVSYGWCNWGDTEEPPANPPKPPPGEPEDDDRVPLVPSRTPEDKFGPAGYDDPEVEPGNEDRFILPGQVMEYRIDFWNHEDAEVPTQDAVIFDWLDPEVFDVSTFEFTRIGFLDWDVPLPGGQVIDTRIDAQPEMNIAVEVRGGWEMNVDRGDGQMVLDDPTGKLVWWFHTIDPETGEPPDDPMAGFLPPFNPETGYELGWIEFRVTAWDDLPTGTRIENQAFVQFDFMPNPKTGEEWGPAPPDGPWVNTIDAGPPASWVDPLPEVVNTPEFLVTWDGADDEGGSGIARYDIYVSTDGGGFTRWLAGVTETLAVFTGEPGHTYAFYAVATDNVGHREPVPAAAEAETYVNIAPVVTSVNAAPDPVTRSGYLTLTAQANDTDGEVVQVAFYRDSNGDGVWDAEDELLDGEAVHDPVTGTWTLAVNTADWALGEHLLLARALDNDGAWSEAVDTTVTIENAVPTIGALLASPDTVTRPGQIMLTAEEVSDPDGHVARVEFYRGEVSPETLLGTVLADGDWVLTGVSTDGWTVGPQTLLARAVDNDGASSEVVSTTVTVENAVPTIGALVASPDPVTRPGQITLTAEEVGDPDGHVARVEFYRGVVSPATLLGTVLPNGDWVLTGVNTAGWTVGPQTLLAWAVDNDGASSEVVSTTVTVYDEAVGDLQLSLSESVIDEHRTTTLSGLLGGLSVLAAHTVTVDWGDDSEATVLELPAGVGSFTAPHQYLNNRPDDAPYTIRVTVMGSDGASASGQVAVTVNNVAPSDLQLTLSAAEIDEWGRAWLSGSFADPGTLDTHTVTIDWDDGTSEQVLNLPPGARAFSEVMHTFAVHRPHGQSYTIRVTVADEADSTSATVSTVWPWYDFGDAPDSYGTLLASNGARHRYGTGLFLGALVDVEPDGQPTWDALGDDTHGLDDEDGVEFTSVLRQGQMATVQVTASMPGLLDAFVDFHGNGTFAGPGDKIFDSVPLAAGVNQLQFPIPADAVSGPTYARFRISSAGGLSFDGPAADGEVEDYRIVIGLWGDYTQLAAGRYLCRAYNATPGGVVTFVYGTQTGTMPVPEFGVTLDILDPTFFAQGGANTTGRASVVLNIPVGLLDQPVFVQAFEHAPSPQPSSLIVIDDNWPTVTIARAAGQPERTSDAGVRFAVEFSKPVYGFGAQSVVLGGTAAGDLAATVIGNGAEYEVTVHGMTGTGTVLVSVPDGAAGDAAGNPNWASGHQDGWVIFLANPWQNYPQPHDVADNGHVGPLDALMVINWLNTYGMGPLPPEPPGRPMYVDVDGNGVVAPLDALLVINYINYRADTMGEGESATGTLPDLDVLFALDNHRVAPVTPIRPNGAPSLPTDTIKRPHDDHDRSRRVRQVWDNADEPPFWAADEEPEEAAVAPALLELDEILPDLAAELLWSGN